MCRFAKRNTRRSAKRALREPLREHAEVCESDAAYETPVAAGWRAGSVSQHARRPVELGKERHVDERLHVSAGAYRKRRPIHVIRKYGRDVGFVRIHQL